MTSNHAGAGPPRIERKKGMKFGIGMILGLLGGLLGLVGVFLPWASASAGGITISVTGACFGGMGSIDVPGVGAFPCGQFVSGEGAIYAWGVLAFSVLGLIFVLPGKKATSTLALVMGLLVVVLAGIAIARISQLLAQVPGMSLGYGIMLSIVGGILLLVGGVFAMRAAGKAAGMMPAPVPPPMETPPNPPM